MTNPTNSEDVKAGIELVTDRAAIWEVSGYPSDRRVAAALRTILAALTAAEQARDEAREALSKARKIIAEIDEYQRAPERGDPDHECACCMGELLDDDRTTLAEIDAIINPAKEG